MAVLEILRTESSIQFIDTARKLSAQIRRFCIKLPKRYTFWGLQQLCELADDVYIEVVKANSTYIGSEKEYWIRKEHLIEANNNLWALKGLLSVIAEMLAEGGHTEKWITTQLEQIIKLLLDESKLISGVKKSDKKKLNNILN